MSNILTSGCKNANQEEGTSRMKRLRLCIIAILTGLILLSPGLICAQIMETGSLYNFLLGTEPGCEYDNWVTHVAERIANPGLNFYAPWDRQTEGFGSFVLADSLQNRNWNSISQAFCGQRWQSVTDSIQLSGFPYDLIHFFDTDQNRDYFILRERLNRAYDDNGTEDPADDEYGSFDYGWGLYIFDPHATNPVIVTVPHPNDDFIGVALGWKAFTTLNARFMMISGAGREVAFQEPWFFNNNYSLSDPTRNPDHPFNFTYKAAANNIRSLLNSQNSRLGREFSLQVHSYDSDGSPNRPNCQVSSGNSQNCINLPTRDLSRTGLDMINAAGYIIHPAGHLGNPEPVLTNNFWTVYNSYYSVPFNDGVHAVNIGNSVNLPGYGGSQQMLYTLAGWSNFDVFDPFFHIEMDELPNCYEQTDSTMAWFYGYNFLTQSWDVTDRYQRVIAYYTPWVNALAATLPDVYQMDDGHAPATPHITAFTVSSNYHINITANRAYEYDFQTWIFSITRMRYLGSGMYQPLDTLYYSNHYNSSWVDQGNTGFLISALPRGYTYAIRLGALDKSDRLSGWSNTINVTLYNVHQYVSDLSFDPAQTDNDQLTLRWSAVQDSIPFAGYQVSRRLIGDEAWDWLDVLPVSATSFTDYNFGDADILAYEYYIDVLGVHGQRFMSNLSIGWLRCYPAPEITVLRWREPEVLHLEWQPILSTIGGRDDLPDYYLVSVADNPELTDCRDFVVPRDDGTPAFDLAFPHGEAVPPRWFMRVTAMANQLRQ